jgi:hypothetical protein
MDRLLLKALGAAYRKHYPIDPVLTPRMQVLLLRIAASEGRLAGGRILGGRNIRAAL